jgi:RHS repeat-associated protein
MYRGGNTLGARDLGNKHYELGNHLGNVLAVVTDNIHMADDLTTATVASASDYYPFGMQMDSRTVNDGDYRYGFNGKEKDQNEEFGNTHYDYGFRIYNPAIAKFLSVDPLTSSYPMLTPYQFASNTPIAASDLDGLGARIDITFNQEDEDYLNGIRTYNEIKADRDARAVGAIMGAGIVLTRGAILRYGDRIVPWLYSNPTAPMTGTAVLWGAFLDEEFPGPTHVDDAARNARKTGKVMLDVFGGSKTKIRGAINVDPLANSGVPKEIGELFDLAKRKNLLGTVDEIFATNLKPNS